MSKLKFKMDLFTWEFSKEVEPELEKFLMVVDKNQNRDVKTKQIFENLFPELQNPQNATVINKTILNEKDIIIIEDEEAEQSDFLPDLSVINLTMTEPEENTLNSDVHDFIRYIQESLEIEETVLEKEDIIKLTAFNKHTLIYLFTKIYETMSEQALRNFSFSISKYSDIDLNSIPEQFCRIILLSKLQSAEPSQTLQVMIKEFNEIYSQIVKTELLIPLLKFHSKATKWISLLISMIPVGEKQYFLRDFVYSCNDLEEWQLSTLQSLLSLQSEDSVKRRLINLIEVSADKFTDEKLYLKLIITLIQTLGEGFEDQEQILFNSIEKNKTLLKTSAHKALREWANKFND